MSRHVIRLTAAAAVLWFAALAYWPLHRCWPNAHVIGYVITGLAVAASASAAGVAVIVRVLREELPPPLAAYELGRAREAARRLRVVR